jgi:hypothetical protein
MEKHRWGGGGVYRVLRRPCHNIYVHKFNAEHNNMAKIMQWLKEYTHNNKVDNKLNYKIHSESSHWFSFSVFHAESGNLKIASQL